MVQTHLCLTLPHHRHGKTSSRGECCLLFGMTREAHFELETCISGKETECIDVDVKI